MTHDLLALGAQVKALRRLVQDFTAHRHLRVLPAGSGRVSVTPPALSYSRMWLYTALTGTAILVLIFGGYEVVERLVLLDAAPGWIYALHIARGMGSAIVLGTWGFVVAARTRRHYAQELNRKIEELEEEVNARTADLERSQAFTEHVFASLHDRIVVTDRAGRVVKVNRVARDGVPRGCGRACGVDERCDEACRLPPETTDGLRRDPVTHRLFEVQRYPVPARDGEPELVLEVARDVTDAKRLEAVVVHQEKMASLGVLAAGIAHDIGNPLASLSSELEMLELEPDPCRMGDSIGVLREHVDRIGRALREMVDFARRRGDEALLSVSVATAVDDALRLVRHDKRMRNVELSLDVPSDLPSVRIVEDHLVLVLVNLALNALDAMEGQGALRVAAVTDDETVRITVSDSGPGMPPEVVARVFEPLYTTKSTQGGTGLGLTVSQSVIRAAGGRMEIVSEPGRGTDVILTLLAGDEDG
ncbi:MAG: ATP-binding protein [Sandaracinaceae bacterium]